MGHCNFKDLQKLPYVVKGMKISGDQYGERGKSKNAFGIRTLRFSRSYRSCSERRF